MGSRNLTCVPDVARQTPNHWTTREALRLFIYLFFPKMNSQCSVNQVIYWKKYGFASNLEAKVKVKVARLCLTLCHPVDCIVHGILQGRILELVAFTFFRGSSQPRPPALQVDSLPAEPQGKPYEDLCIYKCLHHIESSSGRRESLINTTFKRQREFSPEIESQGIRKGYFLVCLQFSGA